MPDLVSVVLPCLNVEETLGLAMKSLLSQTHAEVEVVAIDDGSRDATAAILDDWASRDARVRVLRSASNRGLIPALNWGISETRGEFIARMDADSTSAPRRLERQLGALRNRPEIGVVGSAIALVDLKGRSRIRPKPVRCFEPDGARFMALFANPLAHVTVMARTELMRAYPYGASADSLHTEDYELFTRMLEGGVSFLNLPEPLVTVAERPDGVSLRHETTQVANFVSCSQRHFQHVVGRSPAYGEHKVLVNRIDRSVTPADLRDGLTILADIEKCFTNQAPNAAAEIRAVADLQRADIFVQAALKGTRAVRIAAARLAMSYVPNLASPHVRRYLLGKLACA